MPFEVGLVGQWFTITGTDMELYFISLVLMLLFAIISLNLSRSGIGKVLRAIHDNDLAAGVLGVNVFRNKLLAFGIGGFMIGVSGGLFGYYIGFISPDYFTLELTLQHYVMLLFGGLGRVWGALLGVGIVTALEGVPAGLPAVRRGERNIARAPFFGIIIIVVLAVELKGMLAALGQLKDYLRKWPFAY